EERVAERERIARELHDTLLQGFQGLMLRFQAVMDGLSMEQPARQQMNAALERADEVLTSGRDRVRDLRTLSSANDLADSLTSAAETALSGENVTFQLQVEGTPRVLHPVVSEELAAIGREAIFNCSQHAHATRIEAGLTYDRRGL